MKADFAKAIRELRVKKGISQRRAAADLGISQALLSHYENGAREPKLPFVRKLCEYYGVSADFVLRRDGGTVTVPCDAECGTRVLGAVSAALTEANCAGGDDLTDAAARFIEAAVANLRASLAAPDAPYNPGRDAAVKTAEAVVYNLARRAAGGAEDAL